MHWYWKLVKDNSYRLYGEVKADSGNWGFRLNSTEMVSFVTLGRQRLERRRFGARMENLKLLVAIIANEMLITGPVIMTQSHHKV